MSAVDRLDQIETRAYTATKGPWAPWLDQDGEEHMGGLLMVGNAEAVIPDGEVYIEGVEINPVAHVYIQEDRDFIAHARTDVPALVAAVRVALDKHTPSHPIHRVRYCQTCNDPWPCEEIRDITEALA